MPQVATDAPLHGQPFVLALAGPRAVRLRQGEGPDGVEVEADPAELVRLLETWVVL